MIKFMARTALLARYPTDDALARICSLGFDGVEICLENDDVHPAVLTDEVIARVRERVEALELAPVSVSYHVDYIHSDERFRETLAAIPRTPQFGTDLFVFAGGRARSGDDEDGGAEWRTMIARTRELVAVAEDSGVRLAQEFEPRFVVGNTAQLLRMFEEVGSDALVANLDLGHVFLCDPDPLEAIRQVGPRIAQGHIENMQAGVHRHLLPWEGDMDLGEYLRTLVEVGFDGGLVLDLYDVDIGAVAGECLAYLRGQLPL
jgi:sugar phosphate isomerase/epimerase